MFLKYSTDIFLRKGKEKMLENFYESSKLIINRIFSKRTLFKLTLSNLICGAFSLESS